MMDHGTSKSTKSGSAGNGRSPQWSRGAIAYPFLGLRTYRRQQYRTKNIVQRDLQSRPISPSTTANIQGAGAFTGSKNSYLYLPSASSRTFTSPDDFTIEFWVKREPALPGSTEVRDETIFSMGNNEFCHFRMTATCTQSLASISSFINGQPNNAGAVVTQKQIVCVDGVCEAPTNLWRNSGDVTGSTYGSTPQKSFGSVVIYKKTHSGATSALMAGNQPVPDGAFLQLGTCSGCGTEFFVLSYEGVEVAADSSCSSAECQIYISPSPSRRRHGLEIGFYKNVHGQDSVVFGFENDELVVPQTA
jgi:hypothetical protein